jgi:hypothetical protein
LLFEEFCPLEANLAFHRLHGVLSQKTDFFIAITVKISNSINPVYLKYYQVRKATNP